MPTMFRQAGEIPTPVLQWNPGDLIEVDYVGGGCLAIHRSVFEQIKDPWFEWNMDRKDLPRGLQMGEDFTFSKNKRNINLSMTTGSTETLPRSP